MAKDHNPTPEVKDVQPAPDINGNQSTNVKPGEPKPEENPAKAATALQGSIKETTLNVSPIAETIDGKEAGAAQSNHALHMSPAGALLDSAIEDRSRIREPRTPDRPGNIYDKNSFSSKIPYLNIGCEQARAVIKHAPTIIEEKVQGTYSKQIPFQEYSNKRRGEAPQSQLHFRSIDFEYVASEYVYSMGQIVDYNETHQAAGTGVTRRVHADQDYPAIRQYLNNGAVAETPCTLANTRGNYILRGIEIDFSRDANGREYFSGLRFIEDRLPVVKSNRNRDRYNMNLEVETNIETQRVLKLIDSDLIKEESDGYNEFAMALGAGRKQFFNLYGDMEGDTGYLAMMAYRFANLEYASINSKLAKAGSDESNVDLVKYFINNNVDFRTAVHTTNLDQLQIYNDVFASHVNDNTLPMIPWYRYTNPSIRQFSNWSTLLTNNKTPKTLIDKAEKVMESFFVKPESWNYLKNTQLFSVVDGYNPNCPITITPGYKVIIREDLNLWADSFDRDNVTDINLSGTDPVYSQAWVQRDRKNKQVNVKHPFVDGLLYFLSYKEDELLAAFGGVDGIRQANGQAAQQGAATGTITYDFEFTSDKFNPVCFLILAALPYMARIRNNNTYRIEDMWKVIGNPADDRCVKASASLALASANFGLKDYAHAVEVRNMSDVGRFRYLYPERFTITDSANVLITTGSNVQYLRRFIELPWYFSEDTICIDQPQNGFFDLDEQNYAMNYPIIRKGLSHSEVEFFQKFKPREMRLILDMLTELPHKHWNSLGSIHNDDVTGYNPAVQTSLRHDEYTTGRVILGYQDAAQHDNQTDSAHNYDITITHGDVIQTPRELGFFGGYLPYTRTIINGHDGITLTYDATARANIITMQHTLAHPVETLADRIEAIQNAMDTRPFEDAQHNRILDIYDMPVGAGIYGESYELYWNQYAAGADEGIQLAAGYLQIYDKVYDLYTQVANNQNVLHDHGLCFGLGFNFAPYGYQYHNAVHDIYLKNQLEHAVQTDFYYDATPAHGYMPYPALTTTTATRCINQMLTTMFKPYNFIAGIEVPRAIDYSAPGTDPTVVRHSTVADNQLDLFEMAFYFNFVGFDATYYVNDVNDRKQKVNDLNDGYTRDYFVENSLVLQ